MAPKRNRPEASDDRVRSESLFASCVVKVFDSRQ